MENSSKKSLSCKKMQVIPPGMDFSSVKVQEDADDDATSGLGEGSPKAIPTICSDVSPSLPASLWVGVCTCHLCCSLVMARGHSCRLCDSLQIRTSQ